MGKRGVGLCGLPPEFNGIGFVIFGSQYYSSGEAFSGSLGGMLWAMWMANGFILPTSYAMMFRTWYEQASAFVARISEEIEKLLSAPPGEDG